MNTAVNQQPTTPKLRRRRRLGLWYRAGWRFNYMMLGAYGPAQLGGDGQPDPRVLMRQERAELVRALEDGARPVRRLLR